MQDSDTPIPEDVLKSIEEEAERLAEEEEKILAEAEKLTEEAERQEREIMEEVERIKADNPELVFEPNPNIIGDGVTISPDVMKWALAHGMFGKPQRLPGQPHPRKKSVPHAKRVSRRKMQKKSRKANRKAK